MPVPMITESEIAKVMGELGRRGRGKSKVRGNAKYYQELQAKRKFPRQPSVSDKNGAIANKK